MHYKMLKEFLNKLLKMLVKLLNQFMDHIMMELFNLKPPRKDMLQLQCLVELEPHYSEE